MPSKKIAFFKFYHISLINRLVHKETYTTTTYDLFTRSRNDWNMYKLNLFRHIF